MTARRIAASRASSGFIWVAALVAAAFAGVGALIVAGAGPTPIGQIFAVLVGFLLLGAGAAVALAIGAPHTLVPRDGSERRHHS